MKRHRCQTWQPTAILQPRQRLGDCPSLPVSLGAGVIADLHRRLLASLSACTQQARASALLLQCDQLSEPAESLPIVTALAQWAQASADSVTLRWAHALYQQANNAGGQ